MSTKVTTKTKWPVSPWLLYGIQLIAALAGGGVWAWVDSGIGNQHGSSTTFWTQAVTWSIIFFILFSVSFTLWFSIIAKASKVQK